MSQIESIVILTGAGISTDSGLPTFRDKDGLWEGPRVEDVACPEAFRRDPVLVHRFYNLRRAALRAVEPNAAHIALARLQQGLPRPGAVASITQNVNDLHERAGCAGVIHTRYFSDKQCGGERGALKAAEAKLAELKGFLASAPRKDGRLTRTAEAGARKVLGVG